MELHAEYMTLFHGRREDTTVLTGRHCLLDNRRTVGVGEVNERSLCNAAEQPGCWTYGELVPANVWRLDVLGEALALSREKSKPFDF